MNPIFFQSEVEEARMVKQDMQKGKRKIYCELELRMLDDINLHYNKKFFAKTMKKKKSSKKLDKQLSKEELARKKKKKEEDKKYEEKEFCLDNMPKTKEFLQPLNLFSSLMYTFS